MQPLRVTVHASDSLTNAGIMSILRSHPEISVVPEACRGEADVFVLATEVVTAGQMSLLRDAAGESGIRTVLITGDIPDSLLLTAVECGVVAVLPPSAATGDRLVHTLASAADGRGVLPSGLLGRLLDQIGRLQRDVLAAHGLNARGLAPREVDVLRLMADGFDTLEIARKLSYSERTVKNIMHTLTTRLNLRNRSHAVAFALRAGVI